MAEKENKNSRKTGLKSIKHTKLSEQFSRQILDLISDGVLKPGDKVPTEMELVKEVGVSRTTVREGMQRLAMLGIIEIKPGQGTFVREDKKVLNLMLNLLSMDEEIKKSTILELLELRKILEIGIIDIFVKKATDKDLKDLKEYLKKHRIDIENNINPSPSDIGFHNLLVKATRNKVLMDFFEGISELIQQAAILTGNFKENSIISLGFHEKIFNALEKRDSELAAKEMIEHINWVIECTTRRKTQ